MKNHITETRKSNDPLQFRNIYIYNQKENGDTNTKNIYLRIKLMRLIKIVIHTYFTVTLVVSMVFLHTIKRTEFLYMVLIAPFYPLGHFSQCCAFLYFLSVL